MNVMRKILRFGVIGLSIWGALLAVVLAQAANPVVSVAEVDLTRYSGKWFEIASFPMFFQRKCVADTTAEYKANGSGGIRVVNRCTTEKGVDEAVGVATVVPEFGNSRLKVSFFWPFTGDYWILGLDPEYRWAVVGSPNRKYLWILSRTAKLPAPLLDAALAAAQGQGFDLKELRYTSQKANELSR